MRIRHTDAVAHRHSHRLLLHRCCRRRRRLAAMLGRVLFMRILLGSVSFQRGDAFLVGVIRTQRKNATAADI